MLLNAGTAGAYAGENEIFRRYSRLDGTEATPGALFCTGRRRKRSHLERYASRLRCTEINSSFHRPHRRATWERWAATTPEDFRFAVKAPKAITHIAKLVNTGGALLEFFEAVGGLGHKLGPVLVQLPPKLSFDEGVAHEFFTTLRELHRGAVVLEPRHPSWFTASVDRLLRSFEIARAAADPPKVPYWPPGPADGRTQSIGVFTAPRAPTIQTMTRIGCKLLRSISSGRTSASKRDLGDLR